MEDKKINSTEVEEQAAPKRRGRPKKSETASTNIPSTEAVTETVVETPAKKRGATRAEGPVNGGAWSNPGDTKKIGLCTMNVEIEFLERALGTWPSNDSLLSTYIASQAPDAPSTEEEIAQLGPDEVYQKGVTIYPKGTFILDEEGRYWDILDKTTPKNIEGEKVEKVPMYWNYQLRGAFKDSCGFIGRTQKDESLSGKLKAYKKVIDGGIFVFPRRIAIDIPDQWVDEMGNYHNSFTEEGNLPILERPIRINGPQGERTAIAASEVIPAGSRIKFTIGFMNPDYKATIVEWLNYGAVHGLSGWRNSGLGIFRWRELDSNFQPFTEE